jgi:rod shape determining protein RodA
VRFHLGLLALPALIFAIGTVSLVSIAPNLARNQSIFFIISVVIYFVISQVDFAFFKYYWKHISILVFVLLVLTYLLGQETFGAIRWLQISNINIQPSELAKFAVVISLPAILVNFKSAGSFKKLLLGTLLITPFMSLVAIQPDLGTAIVIAAIFLGITFYFGLDLIYFAVGLLLFGVFSNPVWNLLKDYQKQRILVFLNPGLDLQGSGYNVAQSVIAVGSGQLLGRGFGRGTQSHLQFLPVYWTDFIFASFAEEWGFIGVAGILFLYVALLLTLLSVAHKTEDLFGKLLCAGVFSVFFAQFVINIGMNLGIMPVTGIPLPLVSYGGSSLITSLLLLGIVQSVWLHTKRT